MFLALNLVFAKKQRFGKHMRSQMGEVKQINIKNRTYYFYDDINDLKEFDAS